MKKHMKRKWVEALESGEYSQTRNKLVNKKGDAFCCLGVLCNIQKGMYWEGETPYNKNGYEIGDMDSLVGWFGNELGLDDVDIGQLIDLNDTHKKNFKTIAKYIRENVKAT